MQIDAFTSTPLQGNPVAVITDATGLTETEMQQIAREMNLSETAFVFPSTVANFRVRYFTPRQEIPLAGQPTIAAMHALLEEGRIPRILPVTRVTQELNVGILPVDIFFEADGRERIVMTQKPPVFSTIHPAAAIAPDLGLTLEDLDHRYPLQTVSTGTPQLMVYVRTLRVLERVRPSLQRLATLTQHSDFFSIHVFALGGYTPGADVHARHFAPGSGVDEDPVTGSASGSMGAYLVRYGLVNKLVLKAEQGNIIGRPGVIAIEVVKVGEQMTTVKVGGEAVTVLTGELRI